MSLTEQLKKGNERKHIYYFDYLRIIAMFSVVFMHVAAGPLRGIPFNGSWQILNLLTSFAFTAVPIFFMISGYLIISDQHSDDIYRLLYKKIPRLLVPLAAWTVIAVVMYSYFDNTISVKTVIFGIMKSFRAPVAIHFWYLYTLIAIYFISPVLCNGIRHLSKQGKILVLAIVILTNTRAILLALLPESLTVYTELDFVIKMEFFGAHLGTFILGYFLGTYNKKINTKLLICIILITFSIISIGTYLRSVKAGSYNQVFQNQSAGFEVVLAGALFLLFKQNINIAHNSRIIKTTIKLSLAVYLMHNLLISVFYHCGYMFNSLGLAIVGTIIVSAISIVTMWIATMIPSLCFLLTGEYYRK